MKIQYNVEVRVPGKMQYSFFNLPSVPIEVDVPDKFVLQYPGDDDTIYLTLEGLNIVYESLADLREQKSEVYTEEDVEEGW